MTVHSEKLDEGLRALDSEGVASSAPWTRCFMGPTIPTSTAPTLEVTPSLLRMRSPPFYALVHVALM